MMIRRGFLFSMLGSFLATVVLANVAIADNNVYRVLHLIEKEQLASIVYQDKQYALTTGESLPGSSWQIVSIDRDRMHLESKSESESIEQAILYRDGFLQTISRQMPASKQIQSLSIPATINANVLPKH